MTSRGKCPRGVLVNAQEWGCFSIFRRADDVTRTMSKGGVLVNVQEWGCFTIFRRADDVKQTMSKGGGVLVECLHPPPFRKSCIRACYLCKISGKSTPLPPLTKAFPYAYDSTHWFQRYGQGQIKMAIPIPAVSAVTSTYANLKKSGLGHSKVTSRHTKVKV